jgi:hypothetical protein
MAFNDFREIQLGLAPALFALAFHAEGRLPAFLVAALLMLACRGEYAFLLACVGILNWRLTEPAKRDAVWLAAPPLLALVWVLWAGLHYQLAYGIFFPWGAKLGAATPGGVVAALLDRLPTFFRTMSCPQPSASSRRRSSRSPSRSSPARPVSAGPRSPTTTSST